jgi:glutathione peroxidase-family protein
MTSIYDFSARALDGASVASKGFVVLGFPSNQFGHQVFGTARIKWNFTKFLVDSQGRVRKRYAPTAKPSNIENAISALL